MNGGRYLAEQALANRLVDALGYRDEVYAAVRKQVGNDPILLYVGRYQRSKELANRAKQLTSPRQDAVALIQATGAIRRGPDGRSPLTGTAMRFDSLTAAPRAATDDPHIQPLVLSEDRP